MYNGEKYVLGKYKTRETQRMLISVGLRVMLRLTQVYLNLLNNAVKYTNPGGSIRLEISEELAGLPPWRPSSTALASSGRLTRLPPFTGSMTMTGLWCFTQTS